MEVSACSLTKKWRPKKKPVTGEGMGVPTRMSNTVPRTHCHQRQKLEQNEQKHLHTGNLIQDLIQYMILVPVTFKTSTFPNLHRLNHWRAVKMNLQ